MTPEKMENIIIQSVDRLIKQLYTYHDNKEDHNLEAFYLRIQEAALWGIKSVEDKED